MQKQKQKTKQKLGAFDIRNVIGILLGFYGIVLVLMGLVADPELAKTGGINANLIAGIALIVVAGVFLLWAWLRPLVVQRAPGEEPRA